MGRKCQQVGSFHITRGELLGLFLAPYDGEHHVSRAVVLSLVVTLAVGQDAALLCRAWCNPQMAAASGCLHQESANSPSVAGDNNCDHVVLSVSAFLRAEVRPGTPSPDVGHAIVAPPYQLAHSTTDARRGQEPGRGSSLQQRPLATALRI